MISFDVNPSQRRVIPNSFASLQDELSRNILLLQKEHFFDDLTAKYWNASLKGSCVKNDDSEGITLESLGGVFIATFVGLGEF